MRARPPVRGACCYTGRGILPGAQWSGPAVGRVTWNAGWGGREGGRGKEGKERRSRASVLSPGGRDLITWVEEGQRCGPITPAGRGKEAGIRGGCHVVSEHAFRFRRAAARRGAMQPAAGAPRPGPAAAKKKKKMKKTKKMAKQLRPRAEAAEEAAAAAERAAAEQAAEEAARRARHLKSLSRRSGGERELEELVFGDSLNVEEDELLQRLAGPRRVGLGARRALPPHGLS